MFEYYQPALNCLAGLFVYPVGLLTVVMTFALIGGRVISNMTQFRSDGNIRED